jgi:uncharacterized protein
VASEPNESSASSWVLAAVLFEFSLVGLASLLGWLFGINPFSTLTWRDPRWLGRQLLWGGLGVVPLLGVFLWLRTSRLAVWRELREFLQEELIPYFSRATPWELAWVALAAGVGEELLFRGFLLSALQARLDPHVMGGWLPLILSSVVFGLAHCVSWTYLVLASVVGLYLGWLMLATGSLWAPMTTHAVYDLAALWWLCRDYQKNRAT